MGILDILWIYLILTTIQPIITQKWLEAARLRLLRKLERSRGSRVIALVHRQETMSLLGFPIFHYINIVEELGLPVSADMPADVYRFMELFPQPKQRIPSVQYVPVPARQRGGHQNQQ